MRAFSRILLLDDDKPFNDILTERLRERGYEVESSYGLTDALTKLDTAPWDIVVVDLKLDGRDGADVGIDALGRILAMAPAVKPIIITAYADPDSVERAFKNGAYDYVEKTDFRVFEALLLAKVRNALEPAREARIAALVNGERERQLIHLWHTAMAETSRQRKGTLLEELMLVLWRSIPGFEQTVPNSQSNDEEIDLVVVNQSKDEFWKKESTIFLIECKNWMTKVDPREIDRLFQKIERKQGRCRLGFFVAPEGFTTGVETTLLANRKDDKVIVPLAKEALLGLVQAQSPEARNQLLKDLVLRAVVESR